MNPTAASLIVNDRVAAYPRLDDKEVADARRTFTEALALARGEHTENACPDLLVVALCNLAAFEYRLGRNPESMRLFSEALKTATEYRLASSEQIDILEDAAVVCRASKDFDQAQKFYERALALKNVDRKDAHHAMSHANLAALAHDRHDSRGVEMHHSETHIAVNGEEFVSASHTPNEKRPQATWGFEKPKEYLPEMLTEANSIISMIKERQINRQQEELLRRENEARKAREAARLEQMRRQKIADALNAKSGDAETAPPFADIAGKVVYPLPDPTEFRVLHSPAREKTVATESKDDKALKIPVDIVLCKYEVRDALARYLVKAAKERTQAIEELGVNWPATKLQAKPVLSDVIRIALDHKLNRLPNAINSSNEEGEYIFRGVPKGQFFIFAPLPCKSEYLFWLVPVSVQDKKEVTIDLLQENVAHYIWRDKRDLKASEPNK
jgi:tetratricopeptide (TPR) repeat protein